MKMMRSKKVLYLKYDLFSILIKSFNSNFFKLIIAAAFYPNYFNVSNQSEDSAIQKLAGREPRNTINVNKA